MGQSAEVMREEGIDEMGRRGEKKRGQRGKLVRASVLAYEHDERQRVARGTAGGLGIKKGGRVVL